MIVVQVKITFLKMFKMPQCLENGLKQQLSTRQFTGHNKLNLETIHYPVHAGIGSIPRDPERVKKRKQENEWMRA